MCVSSIHQGTLKSIEGQPLDSQFVLASHSLGVSTWPASSDNCNVQLFSQTGKYRFTVHLKKKSSFRVFFLNKENILWHQEGETLHLSIYSGCKLVGNRINYAVMSQSSGHVISWGQEYLVAKTTFLADGNSSDDQPKWAAELNLR